MSCLLYKKKEKTLILVYLLWGLHLLRTIALPKDASAGLEYTKTQYRWFVP